MKYPLWNLLMCFEKCDLSVETFILHDVQYNPNGVTRNELFSGSTGSWMDESCDALVDVVETVGAL